MSEAQSRRQSLIKIDAPTAETAAPAAAEILRMNHLAATELDEAFAPYAIS